MSTPDSTRENAPQASYKVRVEPGGIIVRCEKPCDVTLAFLGRDEGVLTRGVMDRHAEEAGHG